MKIISWYSCGCASSVATKIALDIYKNVVIARCVIGSEHEDNQRFQDDCIKWFNAPILELRSNKYKDTWDVWNSVRLLKNQYGAPCTKFLKIAVRNKFQKEFNPDIQVFGYTYDEKHRAERFQKNNSSINIVTPLIDRQITKQDCFKIVQDAGIRLPKMYELGFNNNNCIGCVKGGQKYWKMIREHFPETFNRMSQLERDLGYALLRRRKQKLFLNELE